MIAMMPMAEAPNIEKTAFSKNVRRSVFGIGLHSWEQLMLLSLGVAGLIAIAVFVTTAAVVILQRHETAEANRELDEYKLTVESKVADAKKEGIEAGKSAGNALLRAADLEKQAEQLRKDTAEANARAAAASLELERLKAPRTPSFEAFVPEINKAQPSAVEILYVQECSDCRWLADNIWGYLKSANWPVSDPRPIEPPADIPSWLTDKPSAMKVGASPWGVTILTKNRPIDLADNSAFNCLFRGLFKSLGSGVTPGGIGGGIEEAMPDGLIRVIVAPRA
jgi:hypothetical protein